MLGSGADGCRIAINARRRAVLAALLCMAGFVTASGPARSDDPAAKRQVNDSLAQAAPLPARRGGANEALPPLSPAAPPSSVVDNPPVPPMVAPLATAPKFLLSDITVDGNTVLDAAKIEAVIASHRGTLVSISDLDDIRRALTRLYIEAGYINSGVVIPNQDVASGVVRMHAIEGRITDIAVAGANWFNPDYFETRLAQALNSPFNIRDAETEQQILLQDPLVGRLNIELLPGAAPGAAHMKADVTEGPQYSVGLQIANDQSPTVGEVRGQIQASLANLYGYGDVLSAQYGRSDGLNDGSVSYSIPLDSHDTRVTFRYDRNGTLVVDPALSPLNVTSDYTSLSLGVSRPVWRTPSQNLTLGLSLDWRRAQSFLLDTPFPFVAGADPNGRTNVTALRFTQSWLDRDADHALALRSTMSFGLHLLDSTVEQPIPGVASASSEFFSWLGQAQYVHRVFDDWEAVLRSDLQLSNSPLFPIEQFALGGIDTVRGYRQYLTVTDDAFFASGELRIPVARLKVPNLSGGDDAGQIQLAPFYDYGRGWNVGRPTPNPQDISSLGIGVRWLIGPGTTAELYNGHALRHVPVGTALQDRGIHFRLAMALF